MSENEGADQPGDIRQFFVAFEEASRDQDWARYGEMFLPRFMSIDPDSVVTVARDDLIAFLPHRQGIFERAHATGTSLASLDVESLDGRHALARTTWDVTFDHVRPPVALRATFVLRNEDRWRIAVYLNHDSLLKNLGLD